MTGHGFLGRNLTHDRADRAAFLTLTLLVVLFSTFSHADQPPAASVEAAKLHISEVTAYLRKEGLKGTSLLPSDVRETLNWISSEHGMTVNGDDEASDNLAPLASEALTEPHSIENPFPSLHLDTNLHHKGFLPIHDSMVIGTSFHHTLLGDKLQFTTRPFFGQSWLSLRHYWGGEMSMNIAERPDNLPWGKITMNYTGGTESLTDHGRGIDLHGDVNLTNNWQFTSGIRQNNASGNNNYVSLRWKLDFP